MAPWLQTSARTAAWAALAGSLSGCEGLQSTLGPHAGREARLIAEVSWVLFVGGSLVFVLVTAVAAVALAGPPRARQRLARPSTVIAAGAAFPVVTLGALLVYTLGVTRSLLDDQSASLTIEVVAEQWWWRIHYLDEQGATIAAAANEIHVPVGRRVEIRIASADVIHSLWIPNLAGKTDAIPGRINRLRFTAEAPGTFRGQCAEFCGGPHARMGLHVVAEEPIAFDRWLERQRAPALEPRDAALARGRALFVSGGCGVCHTVRGTGAAGTRGPDLTHVGGRLSIAAATLPTNRGTLAAWITTSQHIKPGNLMPSFATFGGEELRHLAAWLESLE